MASAVVGGGGSVLELSSNGVENQEFANSSMLALHLKTAAKKVPSPLEEVTTVEHTSRVTFFL